MNPQVGHAWPYRPEVLRARVDGFDISSNQMAIAARTVTKASWPVVATTFDEELRTKIAAYLSPRLDRKTTAERLKKVFGPAKAGERAEAREVLISGKYTFNANLIACALRNARAKGECHWRVIPEGRMSGTFVVRGEGWTIVVMCMMPNAKARRVRIS